MWRFTTSPSAEGAQRTAARVRAAGAEADVFRADLTDGGQAEGLVAQVVARFGRIDGLVNNAGRTQVGPFLEIAPEEWNGVIATDLTAAFHTCRAALPSMVERGSGAIVNICLAAGPDGYRRDSRVQCRKGGRDRADALRWRASSGRRGFA